MNTKPAPIAPERETEGGIRCRRRAGRLGRRCWLGVVSLWAVAAVVANVPGEKESTDAMVPLCAMTYNIRYANSNPGEAWVERRPMVRRVIERANPDVFGVQEAVLPQLKDLAADLPAYGWIGEGREGGGRGEFCAVFYRRERLEALESGHFWLSDRPEEPGSATWGNHFPRMVTWVRFRDRATGSEFLFLNTHFDHQSERARNLSAELIRTRIAEMSEALPVVLAGDFNAPAGQSEPFASLTRDGFLSDTWDTARERVGANVGTFNAFKQTTPAGPRIDWVLAGKTVGVDSVGIDAGDEDGRFPSDHFPVIARLRIPHVPR